MQNLPIREYEPIAPYTTMGVGGEARYFIKASSSHILQASILFAREKKIPFYIFGGGSNIIFSDEGYNGLLIYNDIKHFDFTDGMLTVGSGYMINEIILHMKKTGHIGFEKLFGIPGSIGGAIYQNASAYDVQVSDFFISGTVYDVANNDFISWDHALFHFDYRSSELKRQHGKYILTEAIFAFPKSNYEEFQSSLRFVNEQRNIRPIGKSCGSFFTNPPAEIAGKLIEGAGLKGYTIGGAQVSPIHANYIMNIGNAKACDIHNLCATIQAKVKEKYNIILEPEVRFVDAN